MPRRDLNDAEKKDVEDRIAKFKEGHMKLVEDLQIDIGPLPIFQPIGPVTYGVAISMEYMDLKYRVIPSPIQVAPPHEGSN
jgi:hypothetical protein